MERDIAGNITNTANPLGGSFDMLASAARTTTQTSVDLDSFGCRGILIALDMTNATALPSVSLSIKGKDKTSGKYYALLAGAAVTTVSTNAYVVYPGVAVSANVAVSNVIPDTFQIVVTANNANSGTYSVGYSLVP